MTPISWTADQAEDHLLGLELFGMRFGLERMQRLMTALDSPQRRFRSIHVVGTNGKSSTVRMTAAILEAHGARAGAYLSPHLTGFAERIRIGDADLEPAAFGVAVQRAARAAEIVERSAPGDERVTQFELLTAAAYDELARREVEVAVVEAGLGGRYDATNVLPSEVTVLTNVGLEHTRWLGPTVTDIAREKLAVLREGTVLVVGEDLHPDAEAEAVAAARERGARLVRAAAYAGLGPAGRGSSHTAPHAGPAPPARASVRATAEAGPALAALGSFQRANFGLARSAAQALLGGLDVEAVAAAAATVRVPGRFEVVAHDPLTVLDGAHNPGGIDALVQSLEEVADGRRVVAVVSILDDKDAPAILARLLPACEAAVLTTSANPRALPPATLESLARQIAPTLDTVVEPFPHRAVERARELAGASGIVCVGGSIYLVADLKRSPAARRASSL